MPAWFQMYLSHKEHGRVGCLQQIFPSSILTHGPQDMKLIRNVISF